MKLMRVGPLGQEKPAILDKDGKVRDLSTHVSDIGEVIDGLTFAEVLLEPVERPDDPA